jgi:methylmalonyl-CoA mutase cobalamin-binding subunit/DNA-binding transcriptional MerR regulator
VRTAGEQRLYSEDDVERLALLRQLTEAGHSISAIAGVESDELRRLLTTFGGGVDTLSRRADSAAADAASDWSGAQAVVEACMRAARGHDPEAVHRLLQREAFRQTTLGLLEGVAAPFMRRIGDDWADGRVSEAQERAASGALRRVLGVVLQYLRIDERDRDESSGTPLRVIAATLAGERHEIGALMAAAVAADVGCAVTYPGADLPAPALAIAARQGHADIVALSLLDGGGPRLAQRELSALRDALPVRTRIVVGGASAALLDDVLESVGARRVESLAAWHRLLKDRLARGSRGARRA